MTEEEADKAIERYVRVIDPSYRSWHPDENRLIQTGDVVLIAAVGESRMTGQKMVAWKVNYPGRSNATFGEDFQALPIESVEFADAPVAAVSVTAQCICPSHMIGTGFALPECPYPHRERCSPCVF